MGRIRLVISVAALVALWTGPLQAEEITLRQQAMRLNDVTGKDSIKGKIREELFIISCLLTGAAHQNWRQT